MSISKSLAREVSFDWLPLVFSSLSLVIANSDHPSANRRNRASRTFEGILRLYGTRGSAHSRFLVSIDRLHYNSR